MTAPLVVIVLLLGAGAFMRASSFMDQMHKPPEMTGYLHPEPERVEALT
jgi:hypothetical protein